MIVGALRQPAPCVRALRLSAISQFSVRAYLSAAADGTLLQSQSIQSAQAVPATAPQPAVTETKSSPQAGPALRYFVARTANKNLPVYEEKARGGNLHRTRIGKIEGDVKQLMESLQKHLKVPATEIQIKTPSRQILVRGWWKKEITKFLEAQSF